MKGRKRREVEFIQLLAELLDLDGHSANFAKCIGKRPQNVGNYLSGRLRPGKRVLSSAVRHAYEWQVTPHVEVGLVKQHATSLPTSPGVYCLYDSSGTVIYVGQAGNLKQEVGRALQRRMNFPVRLGPKLWEKAHRKYKEVATYLTTYEVPSRRMRHNLEAFLLRAFPNQLHNNKMGKLL